MIRNHSPPKLSKYLLLASILLLGLFYRVRQLGEDPFFQDQAATSMGALHVVQGKWPLVGPMEFALIRDPPLPSYLYAIPFSVTGDPRFARIFTALWNLSALSIAYNISSRYFGTRVGLLALALYATHPIAVVSSRFIWNPNLASPLVMLYVYTGLLGYFESKQLARMVHLPLMALAALCHPSLVLLAPVSVLLWWWAWRQHVTERRQLLIQAVASSAIAMLLLAPWIIGSLQLNYGLISNADISINTNWIHWQKPDLNFVKPILAGEGCWRNNCPMLLGERPPVYLTHLLPTITVVAAMWSLLNNGLNNRIIPTLVIVAAFTVPSTIAAATGRVFDHYVWPLIGNAIIIQASVIGTFRANNNTHSHPRPLLISNKNVQRLINYSYILLMALILIGQTRFNLLYDPSEGLPSLNENLAALRYAQDISNDAQAELLVQDYQPANELRCKGCRGWETLPALFGQSLRVLPQDSGIPSPTRGAFLLRSTSWPHEDNYLREHRTIGKWFRLARIPTLSEIQMDISGAHSFRFANGAVALGLVTDSTIAMPRASEDWITILVWQAGNTPQTDFKFFAHLVDSTGRKYAQVDPFSIPRDYWRAGETVLNELNFSVAQNLPIDGPLFIRFGMYDHHGLVPLLSANQEPHKEYATIQIRGAKTPAWVFTESLALNEFYTATEHEQGPPIFVGATWEVDQDGLQGKKLRWRVTTSDGEIVYETLTNFAPVTTNADFAALAYIPAAYALRIPTDIAPRTYSLELHPVDNSGSTIGEAYATEILVTSRDRNFKLPTMQNTSGATFADQIMLAGYDLNHGDHLLTLTLHWQALAQIPVDYKYFVHVSHASEILAQADAMPDSNRYPTSWWAPHEVFSDIVTIELGATVSEPVRVQLGLYDPSVGRIPVTDHYGNPVPSAILDLGTLDLNR